MTEPAISVIMSVYNGEAYLTEAVESVLSQTFRDFELVILDDGSTDRSLEIVRGYAAKDPRVRPITRENRGLIASLNQLIDEARSPLLARMDADDRCDPERLAKQYAFLAAHPACGVVGSWAHRMGGDGTVWPGCDYKYPVTPAEVQAAIGYDSILAHPAVMYRREVVRQAGGYRPAFKHAEDFDLWLRMADITEICNIPEPLLIYRTHGDQVTSRHLLEQQINVGISLHAWKMRQQKLADPTFTANRLPRIGEIDAFFGRAGIEIDILDQIVPGILYSKRALMNGGVAAIRGYLERGGDRASIWRTVARLAITFGEWKTAAALAGALLKTSLAPRPKARADEPQQHPPIP
jgi:glycosyltransferase involved in cell wall biosynthesis